MAPDTGYPHDLTDLFGLEVLEFDPLAAGRGKPSDLQRALPDEPPASGAVLVRHHRAEGMPDPRHLRERFLCRPAGHDDEYVRPGQSHLHRHAKPPAFLQRPGGLAAPDVQPASAAESSGHGRGEHAPERRHAGVLSVNHQNSPVRIQFYKPMHDFLTATRSRAITICRRMAFWCWTSTRPLRPEGQSRQLWPVHPTSLSLRWAPESPAPGSACWRNGAIDLSSVEKAQRLRGRPVSDLVPNVLVELRIDKRRSEAEIVKVWNQLLDPAIASTLSQPVCVKERCSCPSTAVRGLVKLCGTGERRFWIVCSTASDAI